jgi:hypothetical protein
MNTTILFFILLCIFLVISLGINYSNIFTQTVFNMNKYTPTPISSTKYMSHDDYHLDANACQGVFSDTVYFNDQFIEPMVNSPTTTVPSPTISSPPLSITNTSSVVPPAPTIKAPPIPPAPPAPTIRAPPIPPAPPGTNYSSAAYTSCTPGTNYSNSAQPLCTTSCTYTKEICNTKNNGNNGKIINNSN